MHYKALKELDVSRCVKMDLGATYSYERVQEALKQLLLMQLARREMF